MDKQLLLQFYLVVENTFVIVVLSQTQGILIFGNSLNIFLASLDIQLHFLLKHFPFRRNKHQLVLLYFHLSLKSV